MTEKIDFSFEPNENSMGVGWCGVIVDGYYSGWLEIADIELLIERLKVVLKEMKLSEADFPKNLSDVDLRHRLSFNPDDLYALKEFRRRVLEGKDEGNG